MTHLYQTIHSTHASHVLCLHIFFVANALSLDDSNAQAFSHQKLLKFSPPNVLLSPGRNTNHQASHINYLFLKRKYFDSKLICKSTNSINELTKFTIVGRKKPHPDYPKLNFRGVRPKKANIEDM